MGVKIHRLPLSLANQIAAGEVIERPASVVKELLENALDAGASDIQVEIGCGGFNEITVSDDGEGILEIDLPFAVMPHATSKIQSLSDLTAIQTMGFRGEALASIASVSRFTILSKPRDQAQAKQLIMVAEQYEITPCARSEGTTVLVEDLFYNVPVRKRFLKSERTEFFVIDKVVRCFALSAPEISVSLTHNGKKTFVLPKGLTSAARAQRVQKILGKAVMDAAIPIERASGAVRLTGWITQPDYARSQQDRVWVYVNQRMVNDKLLNHAIKQAYTPYLQASRYPACVLYLTLPASEVDVNVHPTKHELRFHDPRMVHDFVRSTIEAACRSKQPLVEMPLVRQTPQHLIVPMCHAKSGVTPWVAVGRQHALLVRNGCAHLLDVERLARDALLHQLMQSGLPLASRPLFVPVSVRLPTGGEQRLEASFEQLAHLGLTLTWFGDARVLVRAMPVLVPQLQLQAFMDAVLTHSDTLTLEQLFLCLATYQGIDAFATTDEQTTLLTYLEACTPLQQHVYVRELMSVHCNQIFSMSTDPKK